MRCLFPVDAIIPYSQPFINKGLNPAPKTIGEKLRNKRLELNLLQSDLARMFKVSEDCITYWENNRSEPQIRFMPAIISFLGYLPFSIDSSSLGGKIKLYRHINGISQEEFANMVGVNESTVFYYENDKHKPLPKTLKKINQLLNV